MSCALPGSPEQQCLDTPLIPIHQAAWELVGPAVLWESLGCRGSLEPLLGSRSLSARQGILQPWRAASKFLPGQSSTSAHQPARAWTVEEPNKVHHSPSECC